MVIIRGVSDIDFRYLRMRIYVRILIFYICGYGCLFGYRFFIFADAVLDSDIYFEYLRFRLRFRIISHFYNGKFSLFR